MSTIVDAPAPATTPTRRGWLPRGHAIALGCFAVLFAVTWWHPIWPAEQALHHSLTVLAIVAILLVQRRHPFPLSSFVLILVFLALHTVAARWIYSYVPYDQWWTALTGHGFNEMVGWQRNNFDRLVHLSYGMCIAPVLMRFFIDRRSWRSGWAGLVAVDIIISTGALYELLEWGVAAGMPPDVAEGYNGQQGDLWDAQKDMATAAVGAVIVIAIILVVRALRARRATAGRPPLASR
jgi:putative membrane protein